ncbi:MAG TPA: class I SAM-dependent methyltransferase [Terriglobia bacterium]|nr:class I SAM-dependent methyltransferase [Terriglobia bacterium]
MTLLAKIVEQISNQPVLFIFFRSIFEDNFKIIRTVINRDLRREPGVRTLDLGCGPGTFSDLFARGSYVGVDLNPRYIAYAQRKCQGEFILGDAREVNLPERRFDQILVFGLLHHLPDSDARQVLAKVQRLLAPSGRALIIEDIPATSRLTIVGRLLAHHRLHAAHPRRELRILNVQLD